jgi:hypothetical protein
MGRFWAKSLKAINFSSNEIDNETLPLSVSPQTITPNRIDEVVCEDTDNSVEYEWEYYH